MSKAAPTGTADRQLPAGDQIFLDHVGHFVRDPQAASHALARAGFAPTPVSIQVAPDPTGAPRRTGTGNTTAMLRQGYIEILFKTAETPLAEELDAAIARYPGVHLAAFSVADAAAAHRKLAASGFRMRPLAEMTRPVETESGPATAAFTVARLTPGEMPEGRIQMLTHWTEHTVWQPRWLVHPNGAIGLLDLLIVEAGVEEAAERFARFTGRPFSQNRAGRMIGLDRGAIQLVSAGTFTALFPETEIPSLPFSAAYGVAVRSLDAAEAVLRTSGLVMRRHGDALVVDFPQALGRGTWLFVERAADLPWRR